MANLPTRPCTWPDGGCGEPIIDVTSAKSGKHVVLNPTPAKGIVLGEPTGLEADTGGTALIVAYKRPKVVPGYARVVDVYTDHHATCVKWLAKVERDRATRRATVEESR